MKPLRTNVVVRKDCTVERVIGGLIIPASLDINLKMHHAGTIVAVGPKAIHARVGDRVLLVEYAGDEFEENGEKLTILREQDITGIIPKELDETKESIN